MSARGVVGLALLALACSGQPADPRSDAARALSEGRVEEAVERFGALLDAAPDDPAAVAGWCRAMRKAGRLDEVRARFEPLAGSGSPGALLGLGTAAYYEGNYEEAEAPLVRALELYDEADRVEGQAQAVYMAGLAALRSGKHDLAEQRFLQALEGRRRLGDGEGAGRALINLGAARLDLGRLEQAEQAYREAGELLGREGLRALQALALSGLGGVCSRRNDPDGARAAYAESLKVLESLGDQPGVMQAANNLAALSERTGDFAGAVEAADQALRAASAMGNVNAEARALILRSNAQINLGRYGEAEEGFHLALERLKTIDPSPLRASAWIGLGNLAMDSGDHAAALTYFENSRALFAEFEVVSQESLALYNIGTALAAAGRYGEAGRAFRESLALAREIDRPGYESYALTQLARIDAVTGSVQAARSKLQEAAILAARAEDSSQEAHVRLTEGNIELTAGNEDPALAAYRDAVARFRSIDEPAGLANARANEGEALRRLDRIDEAEAAFRDARSGFEELGDRQGVALQLLNLGITAARRGRGGEALELFEQARAMQAEDDNLVDLVDSLIHLGTALEAAGKVDLARARLEEAFEIENRLLLRAGGADLSTGLQDAGIRFSDREPAAAPLTALLARQGLAQEAFVAYQRGRARALHRQLAAAIATRAGLPAELERSWSIAQRDIAAAMTRLRSAALRSTERKQARADLLAAEAEAADVLRRWEAEATATDAGAMHTDFDVVSLQRLLPDDEAVVAYALLDPRSYAWIVHRGKVRQIELPSRSELEEPLRRTIEALDPTAGNSDAAREACAALGKRVASPVLGQIPRGTRLWIVPDGRLSRVPFHALTVSRDGSETFVSSLHATSLLPSAGLLTELSHGRRAPVSTRVLALGNPDFGSSPGASPAAKWSLVATGGPGDLRGTLTDGLFDLKPLPASEREAAELETVYTGYEVRVLTGSAATEEALRAQDLDGFAVVHLATHALVDSDVTGRSAVVLAQDADPAQDGFLTMAEILTLRLEPSVIVLSACQTAGTRVASGEGLQGLARAFLAAGGQAVVASLWPVPDRATQRFMRRFHESLASGKAAGEALNDARFLLMADEDADVSDWAAFVLFGDGGFAPFAASGS